MTALINTHCETALDSSYSREREEAIEELGELFSEVSDSEQTQILETLREVAHDSASRDERALAQETAAECFNTEPDTAESIVVEMFCNLASESKFSEERLDAIDSLRSFYPAASEQYQDAIGKTLADIVGNATYEDERKRAQRRLSDISREERSESDDGLGEEVGYLATSLAEHLETAAGESSERCLERAREVSEFLKEHPVGDDAFDEIESAVDSLVTQLEVVPTGDDLDADRRQRVEEVASRVERLYTRQ